jgi:hypothetical protein
MSLFSSSSLIPCEGDDVCIIGSPTVDDDPAAGPADSCASTVLSAAAASPPPIAPKFNLLITLLFIYIEDNNK